MEERLIRIEKKLDTILNSLTVKAANDLGATTLKKKPVLTNSLTGISADDMIAFCIDVEETSTFRANFAHNMEEALQKYPFLTVGQMEALKAHYKLAKGWKR